MKINWWFWPLLIFVSILLAIGYRYIWVRYLQDNPQYTYYEVMGIVENDLIEKGFVDKEENYYISIRVYAGHGIWRGDCLFYKEPKYLTSNSTLNDLVIRKTPGKLWGLIWYYDENSNITDVVYNPDSVPLK